VLVGNREGLGFELRPLQPTWERRYPPEVAAWAGLSIWVSGLNLCEHIESDADHLYDAVNVPLAPIADWLVRAWPFICYEERPASFAAAEEPHKNLREWGEAAPASGLSEDDWLVMRESWWSRHFWIAGTDDSFLETAVCGVFRGLKPRRLLPPTLENGYEMRGWANSTRG
jgi:hypothetical protein